MGMALWITLRVLVAALPILAVLGMALGYLLARRDFVGRGVLRVAIMLPMAMPPTVLGLYLLMLFGQTPALRALDVLFTIKGAVMAALLPALPVMVSSCRAGFLSVPREYEDAARTLGKSDWQVFWTVTLPLARRHILSGLSMSAVRAAGDFGTTLMVAGNMAGRTQTLPLYIYGRVEMMDMSGANRAALLLVLLAVITLVFVFSMERESGRHAMA